MAELQELQSQKLSLEGHVYDRRKENLPVKLRKLLPGSSCQVGGILDPLDDTIATSPSDRARIINAHWQSVLDAKPTDERGRRQWLQQMCAQLRAPLHLLKPSVQDFLEQLKLLPKSAPGPDGITFRAFKGLEPQLATILADAASHMLAPMSPFPPSRFQLGVLSAPP